jgi:hypothetical protein
MPKPIGYYKKDGKTRPISRRKVGTGTMQKGVAYLGVPKRIRMENPGVSVKEYNRAQKDKLEWVKSRVTISSPEWLKNHPDQPKYVINVDGQEMFTAKNMKSAKEKQKRAVKELFTREQEQPELDLRDESGNPLSPQAVEGFRLMEAEKMAKISKTEKKAEVAIENPGVTTAEYKQAQKEGKKWQGNLANKKVVNEVQSKKD